MGHGADIETADDAARAAHLVQSLQHGSPKVRLQTVRSGAVALLVITCILVRFFCMTDIQVVLLSCRCAVCSGT